MAKCQWRIEPFGKVGIRNPFVGNAAVFARTLPKELEVFGAAGMPEFETFAGFLSTVESVD
jgi:hypothetical protein